MNLPSMAKTTDGDGVYLISALAGISLWSTSFVVTKLAYATFPPLTLGVCRFLIASAALTAFLFSRRRFMVPSKKDLLRLSLSGFLGITLYFGMENIGVKMTSASNAALIVASYPAITLLMERVVYGTVISPRKWFGIALAIAGVYLVSTSGASGEEEGALWGNIILAATGLVWAVYNFVTRSVVNKYPAEIVSFYQTIAGTAAFLPFVFLEMHEWQTPTASSWAALLYLGVLCSVAAFVLYNNSLRCLSAGTAVTLMNLVPVLGVTLSVVVLGEPVYSSQILGGIIVIIGVFISVRKKTA